MSESKPGKIEKSQSEWLDQWETLYDDTYDRVYDILQTGDLELAGAY